jgi:hypothetical protein
MVMFGVIGLEDTERTCVPESIEVDEMTLQELSKLVVAERKDLLVGVENTDNDAMRRLAVLNVNITTLHRSDTWVQNFEDLPLALEAMHRSLHLAVERRGPLLSS